MLPGNEPATYHVTLTVTSNKDATVATASRDLLIKPTSVVSVVDTVRTCVNDSAVFLVKTDSTWLYLSSFMWNFGDGHANPPGSDTTSMIWNPKYRYQRPGNYHATMTVVSEYGCPFIDSVYVSVGTPSIAAMSVPAPVCARQPFTLTDKSSHTGGKITSWLWNLSDSIVLHDKNPSYKYWFTGNYPVSLEVTNINGCKSMALDTVHVIATPTGKFTVTDYYSSKQGQVICNNLTTDANSYSWTFGNGKSSTDENPVTTYSDDGDYLITLVATGKNNCSDTTRYLYELLFKGLYVPNAFQPTSTNIGMRFFKPVGMNLKYYHLTVFDQWGHLMFESSKLDANGTPIEGWDGTVDGGLQPQGNYIWRISATFVDDSQWEGSDIGVGASKKTQGTVVLIR